MKKLCSILLITALCVSLVACGSKNKEKRQVNSIVNDVKFHAYNKDLDCTIMYNCFYRFDEWGWK